MKNRFTEYLKRNRGNCTCPSLDPLEEYRKFFEENPQADDGMFGFGTDRYEAWRIPDEVLIELANRPSKLQGGR